MDFTIVVQLQDSRLLLSWQIWEVRTVLELCDFVAYTITALILLVSSGFLSKGRLAIGQFQQRSETFCCCNANFVTCPRDKQESEQRPTGLDA